MNQPCGSSARLSINLAFVGTKPTGLTNYAMNLIPELHIQELVLLAALEQRNGYSYHQIPGNLSSEYGKLGHLRRLMWTQLQLPRLCRQLQTSLLFSPIPEAPLGTRCPSVVMVHDFIPLRFPNWKSPLTPYFRYYVPQVLKQARHVLCNSLATAQDIQHFCRLPANKITPTLLAHDATHFRPLDLPTQNYFIYLGRSDPHKNLSRLLSAFAALPPTCDCELWLVGPGDRRYTPALMAQAQILNLHNRVKFLDYVPYDDLPRLINQAIAMVFPSLWEGFGFPVLEAMACGTPVITSHTSALPEVAGDAALFIDPYCEATLTAAMQTVINDAAARSQLRQAGLARASQFSWAKTGAATRAILQRYL